jgi:hypothetical protein
MLFIRQAREVLLSQPEYYDQLPEKMQPTELMHGIHQF